MKHFLEYRITVNLMLMGGFTLIVTSDDFVFRVILSAAVFLIFALDIFLAWIIKEQNKNLEELIENYDELAQAYKEATNG